MLRFHHVMLVPREIDLEGDQQQRSKAGDEPDRLGGLHKVVRQHAPDQRRKQR